ncbi:MAG: hypothetical protein WBC22_06265 [Sedimentisphaerales bacterium]
MLNSEKVAKFLEMVRENYGGEVYLGVKSELAKNPCDSKAKLFATLFQVLGKQEVKGMKHTIEFGEIRYNSY